MREMKRNSTNKVDKAITKQVTVNTAGPRSSTIVLGIAG
jgi:hypothetical protein